MLGGRPFNRRVIGALPIPGHVRAGYPLDDSEGNLLEMSLGPMLLAYLFCRHPSKVPGRVSYGSSLFGANERVFLHVASGTTRSVEAVGSRLVGLF